MLLRTIVRGGLCCPDRVGPSCSAVRADDQRPPIRPSMMPRRNSRRSSSSRANWVSSGPRPSSNSTRASRRSARSTPTSPPSRPRSMGCAHRPSRWRSAGSRTAASTSPSSWSPRPIRTRSFPTCPPWARSTRTSTLCCNTTRRSRPTWLDLQRAALIRSPHWPPSSAVEWPERSAVHQRFNESKTLQSPAHREGAPAAQRRGQTVPNEIRQACPGTHRHGNARAVAAVKYAVSKVPTGRERRGAEGPNSFDCSGLMLAAYRSVGISLPHSSRVQSTLGRPGRAANSSPVTCCSSTARSTTWACTALGNGLSSMRATRATTWRSPGWTPTPPTRVRDASSVDRVRRTLLLTAPLALSASLLGCTRPQPGTRRPGRRVGRRAGRRGSQCIPVPIRLGCRTAGPGRPGLRQPFPSHATPRPTPES